MPRNRYALPLLPPPRTRAMPPGRISIRAATSRVQAEMEARGLGNKQIGAIIGVSEGQASHKVRLTKRSKFNVDELGLIGEHWVREYDAPHGWPFLDWAYASVLRERNEEAERLRREIAELRRDLEQMRKK